MKVYDKCICDENKMVFRSSMEKVFEYEFGSWKDYYRSLEEGSLDILDFEYEDIDRRYFVIDDGGECIVLKDGSIINICWRGGMCRVWREEDEDCIDDIIMKLGIEW